MSKKFPVTGNSRLYNLLNPHVTFFTRRFYREFKVKGFENIPRDEAIIIAPNHQNAFMDAIVLLIPAGRKWQLSYLVRASIFKSNIARKFFNAINMLPVYRKEVDGAASLEKNDDIFENCVYILKEKRPLVLYPEATHNTKRRLIPLKKGVTRIAFAAEAAEQFKLGVKIFPVGIYYTNPRKFNERILIQVGDPIQLSEYVEEFQTSPAKVQLKIKFLLEERLRALMIDIQNESHYTQIDFLRQIDNNYKQCIAVEEDFNNSKIVIQQLENYLKQNDNSFGEIEQVIDAYSNQLQSYNLRDKIFEPYARTQNLMTTLFSLALTLPFFLVHIVHHFIPLYLPLLIINKKIKDPGFYSSIKAAGAMLFFALVHIIAFFVVWSLTQSFLWALGYFILLLVCGEIGLWWQIKFKKWMALMRFNKLTKQPEYQAVIANRNRILDFLKGLN